MKEEKEKKFLFPPMPQGNIYPIYSDPLGMYTGVLPDPLEEPVQDADDL